MAGIKIKIEWTGVDRKWHELPTIDRRILWGALFLSLLLHVMSWMSAGWATKHQSPVVSSPVKIRSLTQSEKKLLDRMKKDASDAKRIIETKQAETEAPKHPTSLGAQDHATQKETKLAKKLMKNTKALDAGPEVSEQKQPKVAATVKPPASKTIPQIFTGPGTMAIGTRKDKPRNVYEGLLPDKSADVFTKPNGGYMEHIDADVADGDRVDMNTSSFRYISYFTGLRKQIELVWVYPADAVQRGLQGAVQLEMTIEKDGRVSKVRVIESSGYATLDENMLKTIKLASPFAPLPKGWGKERLIVTGSFHYILSYASH